MEDAAREMPRYKCHKEVWALKIKAVQIMADGSVLVTPEDEGFAPIVMSGDRTKLGWNIPKPGGYYVVSGNGVALAWSAAAFEGEYTKV